MASRRRSNRSRISWVWLARFDPHPVPLGAAPYRFSLRRLTQGSRVSDRRQAAVCYSTLGSGAGGNLQIGFKTPSTRVGASRPLTGPIQIPMESLSKLRFGHLPVGRPDWAPEQSWGCFVPDKSRMFYLFDNLAKVKWEFTVRTLIRPLTSKGYWGKEMQLCYLLLEITLSCIRFYHQHFSLGLSSHDILLIMRLDLPL